MTIANAASHLNSGVLAALALVFIAMIPQTTEALRSDASTSRIHYGRTVSGYVYMNGGSHVDEQQFMEQRSAPYNLKLVMMAPRLIPLAALSVFVANNATGNIERITLRGPWIYLQLPAGTYTIGARVNRNFFLLRDVQVQDGARRTYILNGTLFRTITDPENRHK
jgi:hypothetical protein